MRLPALWLCSDESNLVNGKRIIAKNWDASLPFAAAAAAAMDTPTEKPSII
jgi:hypothetical protein